MIQESQFDDIRPYYDEEVAPAMQRLSQSPFFALLSAFVFPDQPVEDVRRMVSNLKTTYEFQHKVMYQVNRQIIKSTTDGFSCDGLENITPELKYLFVSNHRDIMLDASLLENVLVDNGHETSEITFGANLMTMPLVVDIGKSNKMFKVERAGNNPKDFYYTSLHLSQYIRHALLEKNESVWIAQRNGRTKNGKDATDQGIIKMFEMSHPEDRIKALADLNMVPVTVSYEWEPCDVNKALEIYESQFGTYTKMPNEDINSILTGIISNKGRVHFHVGKPVTRQDLLPFDRQITSKFNHDVAALMDRRINSEYRLWPNNYIAHDLLYGQRQYRNMYTRQEKEAFTQRLSSLEKYDNLNLEQLREIFLGIYANPVDSYLDAIEEPSSE